MPPRPEEVFDTDRCFSIDEVSELRARVRICNDAVWIVWENGENEGKVFNAGVAVCVRTPL